MTSDKMCKEDETVDRPRTVPTPLECGQPFEAPWETGLTLIGRFPTVVSVSDRTFSGSVEITSNNDAVRGVVAASADVFLVRDGRIVTLPLPQDLVGIPIELGPGHAKQLPALGILSPCDTTEAEKSLLPGKYQLYARVVLHRDDGSSLEANGGPWPLVIQ
jgi:hypothetical protein